MLQLYPEMFVFEKKAMSVSSSQCLLRHKPQGILVPHLPCGKSSSGGGKLGVKLQGRQEMRDLVAFGSLPLLGSHCSQGWILGTLPKLVQFNLLLPVTRVTNTFSSQVLLITVS